MRLTAAILLVTVVATALAAQSKQSRQPNQADPKKPSPTQVPGQPQEPQRAEFGVTSTSTLALPFKRIWQHLTDSASQFAPTVDGSKILVPLAGGKVLCLEHQTGALIWSSEPGGIITAPLTITDAAALIATRRIGPDGSDAGASIRAVDKATGLTIWAHDYPRTFVSPLEAAGGKIYVGSADGALYALSSSGGEILWKADTQDQVRGRPLAIDNEVYFGSDDGALRAVEAQHGNLIWKIQTGGKVASRPAADEHALYFGSGDGYAYSVSRETGAVRWRSRTGAAIEASLVLLAESLLVGSFDNFIYCLSRSSGDRIWKRRLENRIAASPIVEGDANLVAPLRSDYIAVFLNQDGRRVNLYQLEAEFEIVAEPVFSGGLLMLATNKGLVVAAPIRPEPAPATANKK